MTAPSDLTAALLIIGDEILSGRTQDKNTQFIASWLSESGIDLKEVRVVPDDQAEIVDAVNALRAKYRYLLTTGGIGPTHDDITADCVAAAFGRPLIKDPVAYSLLEAHYGPEDFTEHRQRMTRVPEGAALIPNPVSIAPGFQIENVFVMAGVPKIMQAMLEGIRDRFEAGIKVLSKTVTIFCPESLMAADLEAIQDRFSDVSIGSYPFFKFEEKRGGSQVVLRSRSEEQLAAAYDALITWVKSEGYDHEL